MRQAFRRLSPQIAIEAFARDGAAIAAGAKLMTIAGDARAILSAERTALNFIGHLSGIATSTAQFVERIAHTKARIICTRKTTPGLRALEKYAVRCGGGFNHRFGLDDAMLIKDNHIAVAGGIGAVLARAKRAAGHLVKIEIEVDSLDQLEEVLKVGLADVVLIDNFDLESMRRAVAMVAGRPPRHRSIGRHHARGRRRDRGDRRRLSLLRRAHPFGTESRYRARYRDVTRTVIPGPAKGRRPEPGIHMWTAPGLQELVQRADRSDCDHMSGLLSRSHRTAAKMGSATRVPNIIAV